MNQGTHSAGRTAVRVLVVDDNADMRDSLVALLETMGIRATSAASGREALQLCDATSFDVVLSDVVMAGDIGGVQLAEALRARHPSSRVILMTGHESRIEGVVDAGNVPLVKPFSSAQLQRVIEEALRDRA